jgi:prephenate dehydratase/chorismate mutase
MSDKIEDWRAEIDGIDAELLRLLNKRAQLALQVGALKRRDDSPVYDPYREREVVAKVCRHNSGPLTEKAIANIFQRIIDECRRVQTKNLNVRGPEQAVLEAKRLSSTGNMRVAFQGERGAFSEEAATKLLGSDCEPVPCATFEALFAAIDEGKADYILAPFENSLVGSIQRTHDLLLDSSLYIVAEVVRPISHCLIGCQGATLEGIDTVESHPVALAQCERFFAAHPQLKRLATDDTAASVRRVIERGDPSRAAIAGNFAAKTYGGLILQEHLEDHRENYTRFILLSPEPGPPSQGNKLSLVVRLTHRPGAIHRALEPFARRGIDLLTIDSRPLKGRPWQYHFYLDILTPTDEGDLNDALADLRERAEDVRNLGRYPAAQAFVHQ